MLPIRARREKVTACLPRHLGDDVASLGEATDYLTAQPITNRWTPNSKLVLITCPRPDEPIAGLSTSVMAVRPL
jgi:hypothetical protein